MTSRNWLQISALGLVLLLGSSSRAEEPQRELLGELQTDLEGIFAFDSCDELLDYLHEETLRQAALIDRGKPEVRWIDDPDEDSAVVLLEILCGGELLATVAIDLGACESGVVEAWLVRDDPDEPDSTGGIDAWIVISDPGVRDQGTTGAVDAGQEISDSGKDRK